MRAASISPQAKSWQYLLAGLIHALLCVLAFPPVGLWPIALVAPAPLVWVGCRCRGRPIRAAFLAAIGTLPFWVFTHLYLLKVASVGFPLMCLYLSIYSGLFILLLNAMLRFIPLLPAALAAPLAWVICELLRGEVVLTGYSWYLAGHPLIDVPMLAAPAALLSAYFISILVLGLCGAAADAGGWSGRKRSWGGIGAAVVIGVWIFTSLVATLMPRPQTRALRVAVVQTNVPQDNKSFWSFSDRVDAFRRTCELTRQAAMTVPRPEVIIWPETMFPGIALNPDAVAREAESNMAWKLSPPRQIGEGRTVNQIPREWFADELLKMQAELDVPMMVGAIAIDGLTIDPTLKSRDSFRAKYNSAFVINNGLVDPERYDKIDLTPFGEVIPYAWRWPELQQRIIGLGAENMAFELSFGARPHTVTLPLRGQEQSQTLVRVAAPICFEATRPRLCRSLTVLGVNGPAAMMVNMSNDGWFGDFFGREMHMQSARWRCVELNLPMVRAVNTGLSAAIASDGSLITVGPSRSPGEHASRREGILTAEVAIVPAGPSTLFARYGFIPLFALIGAMLLSLPILRIASMRVARRTPRL